MFVGTSVGGTVAAASVGSFVGRIVGALVGDRVATHVLGSEVTTNPSKHWHKHCPVGAFTACAVLVSHSATSLSHGAIVGRCVGASVTSVGSSVGSSVGCCVGIDVVGNAEGVLVGACVGAGVARVGVCVGALVAKHDLSSSAFSTYPSKHWHMHDAPMATALVVVRSQPGLSPQACSVGTCVG
jgi:hypothetical protein